MGLHLITVNAASVQPLRVTLQSDDKNPRMSNSKHISVLSLATAKCSPPVFPIPSPSVFPYDFTALFILSIFLILSSLTLDNIKHISG